MQRSALGPGKGVGFELGWTNRTPRNMPRSSESEDSDRHRRRQEERERRKNREAVEERKRQGADLDIMVKEVKLILSKLLV